MKRITALLLGLTVAAMAVLVAASPAQAGITTCPYHQTFNAGDPRLLWTGSYWRSPKYRASVGNCDGLYILHMGHWSFEEGLDYWDGSYRIRTFAADGVTINYTGPWRSRAWTSPHYNFRPEVSNGRRFEVHEKATACLLSSCGVRHQPRLALTY